MKKENLKIFKKAGILTSSVALAISLTGVPAFAYADEVEENTTIENTFYENSQSENKQEENITKEEPKISSEKK